jgi:hypothetical protein
MHVVTYGDAEASYKVVAAFHDAPFDAYSTSQF